MKQPIDVDLTGAQWFKSSFSGGSDDNCVEAAFIGVNVAVRDSKNPAIAQVYDRGEWEAFIAGVKAGEFDN